VRFSRGGTTIGQKPDPSEKLDAPGRSAKQPKTETPPKLVIARNDALRGEVDATADLSPNYASGSGVYRWKRRIVFAERKLVVHDDFSVANDVDAVFQVNVPQKPVVTGANVRAGRLHIHVVAPADPKIRVLDWTTLGADEHRSGWRIDIEHPPGSGTFDVELGTVPPQ
jgi:hypothetical protein